MRAPRLLPLFAASFALAGTGACNAVLGNEDIRWVDESEPSGEEPEPEGPAPEPGSDSGPVIIRSDGGDGSTGADAGVDVKTSGGDASFDASFIG